MMSNNARVTALGLARDLAVALDRARDRAFTRSRDRAFTHDLVTALDHALASARDLDHSDELVAALDHVLGCARDLTSDLSSARVLTLAGDLDCDLDHARILALDLIRAILQTHAGTSVADAAPMAGRLLAVAIRLLPAADQSRYLEELRAELDAIAAAGGSRRAQLAYALRQVGSAWQLRNELRVPRHRGATR